ncbi:MAG: hypothetical protein SV062_02625 [Thermodesulfobacteriota bacterium]|nr:hypothetical protein [Thermodesulfobacteriota bacterium]
MKKNIVLIIRDGWGINQKQEYNAVFNANTPNVDLFLKKYPNSILAYIATVSLAIGAIFGTGLL